MASSKNILLFPHKYRALEDDLVDWKISLKAKVALV